MEIRKIDDRLSVSPQISPAELGAIAERGFRAIICNRPDGEGADQPSFDEIAAAAREHGLVARNIPVASSNIEDADARAFGVAFRGLPKPVLAYCRSGTRSATLWSLDQGASGRPLSEILSATSSAGYDMSGITGRIANSGKSPVDEVPHRRE